MLPLFYTEIQKVMTEIRQEHPDTDLSCFLSMMVHGTERCLNSGNWQKQIPECGISRFPGILEKKPACSPVWKMHRGDYVVVMDADLQHRLHFCRRCIIMCSAVNMTVPQQDA